MYKFMHILFSIFIAHAYLSNLKKTTLRMPYMYLQIKCGTREITLLHPHEILQVCVVHTINSYLMIKQLFHKIIKSRTED